MTQKEATQLLQKYIEGKANPQEVALIEKWYGALPDKETLPNDRKLLIAADMRTYIQNAIADQTSKSPKIFYRHWISIAAIFLVVLSFGLFIWNNKHSLKSKAVENIMVATNSNERKNVSLPDGSIITLEPTSKITYPSQFSSTMRAVELLEGEAFFDVAHEERRQFNVKLKSGIAVKVLGTSFRVRDLVNEKTLKVTVLTGKVAVQKNEKAIDTLIKDQELAFDRQSGEAEVYATTQTKVVKLSFEGASLAQIIRKMEYVYNIRIQVDQPKLLQLSTSADFNSGQKPSEILDIICRLHKLRFSESKDHKIFKIYR